MSCERVTRLPRRIQQKRERNHPGSSDLFNTAASGGGVWGGTAVQVLGGWARDGCNLLSQTISRFY